MDDVLFWHLIFLLHPTVLHENIMLQLRSFSLEDGITTLRTINYQTCVYFEMKAQHVAARA